MPPKKSSAKQLTRSARRAAREARAPATPPGVGLLRGQVLESPLSAPVVLGEGDDNPFGGLAADEESLPDTVLFQVTAELGDPTGQQSFLNAAGPKKWCGWPRKRL